MKFYDDGDTRSIEQRGRERLVRLVGGPRRFRGHIISVNKQLKGIGIFGLPKSDGVEKALWSIEPDCGIAVYQVEHQSAKHEPDQAED